MNTIFLFNFFGPEMLVIFFAILLLFGGKKIPELMRGIGRGINEFNTARRSLESEFQEGVREAERKQLEKKEEEKPKKAQTEEEQ
ncbi:MAG: twin-arginine translocase TatA/TatE family subunit [Saprospirales bacterium]|nr:twin-arginine translocase TatA/TatE family subunit [Saprospirales bacterium]MBK8491590.1 twin-arginine translocase TatA/TatE family subunit [Saprospirales bacterium]